MRTAALLALVAPIGTLASMYDVVVSAATPPAECALGCAPWADVASAHNTASQSAVDKLWASPAAQAAAGSACAMPSNFAGQPDVDAAGGLGFSFSFGPQCFCAGTAAAPTSASGYCRDPAVPTPQQVHLMFGKSEDELVVSFVTVDAGAPLAGASVAELCSAAGACANASGTTVRAPEPQAPTRVLSYHVVVLPAIARGAAYTYRVRGATAKGAWSGPFALRPRPVAAAPTVLGVVGDLGVYSYNSFGNMRDDKTLQAHVHLGDHAYNMEMGGGARGDAYMIGFEPILSTMPWIPIYGNHELEGSPFGGYCPKAEFCQGRYLNQTRALSRAGASSGSQSTLFYSIDVGLVHIVVLDYMQYIGLDEEAAAQLVWLEGDLAKAAAPAQRAAVPWIMVTGHVPMYASDGSSNAMIKDVEPLLFKYGVDVHAVGHNHYYESEWPTGPKGAVAKKSFDAPSAPVHVITGAGGAPAFGGEHNPSDVHTAALPDFTRVNIYRWSWSRVTAVNATHLSWEQIDNINGTTLDSWTIVQPSHGSFL